MTLLEHLEEQHIRLADCPFCGCKLSDFPLLMTFRPVHSEEYLIAKLEHGHFLGGDNGYEIRCPHCGAAGGRDTCPEVACKKWNRRTENATINSEPMKHGKWVNISIYNMNCSLCNKDFDFEYPAEGYAEKWNFCPNCGAKMDVEGRE